MGKRRRFSPVLPRGESYVEATIRAGSTTFPRVRLSQHRFCEAGLRHRPRRRLFSAASGPLTAL